MNESIELYKSNGLVVITQQGVDNAKSSDYKLASRKQIAAVLGIKGEAATIRLEQAGSALKALSVMRVGQLAQNQDTYCRAIKSRENKAGNVTHTITYVEMRNKSKLESAIAEYLGKSVEQIRAERAALLAKTITVPETK